MTLRGPLLLGAIGLLAIVIAVPALAAPPAKEKVEKTPITLKGPIRAASDVDGETTYTLASGGTTYTLEAGPKWFHGDNHPLKPYVGKSVTVEGEIAAGSTDVDVISVDGTALRGPGKPPWAGGWKKVGNLHPGWSQEKADRMKAKFGECFPPGQCKEKPARGGPQESEAP